MGCSCSKDAAVTPQTVAKKPVEQITARLEESSPQKVNSAIEPKLDAPDNAKIVEGGRKTGPSPGMPPSSEPTTTLGATAMTPSASLPRAMTEAVQRTWQQFAANSDAGTTLFRELIATEPRAVHFFGLQPGPGMYESQELKVHADATVATITKVVQNISEPEKLTPTLQELGNIYGAVDHQHDIFNAVILSVMDKSLGSNWTVDVKGAWVQCLRMASAGMKSEPFVPEVPITPVYPQPESLPVQQEDWVRLTWQTIARDLPANGVALLKELFAIEPAAVAYFGLPDGPDMYSSPEVVKYGESIMKTIGSVIGKIGNEEKLDPVLSKLGGFHGNAETSYSIFGQALQAMLEKSLGTQWTPEVRTAWEDAYRKASVTMMEHGARAPPPALAEESPEVAEADQEEEVEREPEHTPIYIVPEPLPVMEEDGVRLTWQIAMRVPSLASTLIKEALLADEHLGDSLNLNMDDPTVFTSPEALDLGTAAIKYIGACVAKFQDPAKLGPLAQELSELAAKHQIEGPQYEVLSKSLMSTLEQVVGADWKPETAAAWQDACTKVASAVQDATASA